MKVLFSLLTAAGRVGTGPAVAADTPKAAPAAEQTGETTVPGREAGENTSDRTPEDQATTPLPQTTKDDGETSDRTPDAGDGAAE